MEFPSPIGDLFYLMDKKEIKEVIEWFPSPIGDLFYLILNDVDLEFSIQEFPSPIGDLFYLIL